MKAAEELCGLFYYYPFSILHSPFKNARCGSKAILQRDVFYFTAM